MKKRLLSLALAVVMVFSLTACGGLGSKGSVTVSFMYGGNVAMAEMYKTLIEKFNETVGKEKGITVKGIPKSGSLDTVAGQQLPSNSGPDLISLSDEYFKKYCQYLEEISGKIDSSVIETFYPELRNRYRYDIETTTSNEDDPLYGLPAYNDTTVLYYNKTVLEKLNVICISVAEEDLEAFNSGKKDANGKTKADYGIEGDVLAKGFYRSNSPFVPEEGETDGSSWSAPSDDEVMIFNDKIAMNWDEIEDLGMICTNEKNSASPSQYGYYTEWWFNYGWSVGGNCLEDLSGEGAWTYALPGNNPNYIVQEGKSYTGVYTGTKYEAGETLDLKDVLNANSGDAISYETDKETYFEYTVNGKTAEMRDLSAEVEDGVLKELPSTVEAFSRFCYLAGVGGLDVCPYPSVFNGRSSVSYFTSGTLALLVEQISSIPTIEKTMADEWGVAPLPQYKVYTEPSNPECDTVAVRGKKAAHSIGYSISISAKSAVKDQAYEFLNWLATDGQKVLAENGYISSRIEDKELVEKNLPYKNAEVIMDSISTAQAGDWWYMPDRGWIDYWASPLNNQVRFGKMKLEEFLYGYIEGSNERLEAYKQ